jgi:protein-L-isoaspartate(D-aspartate) O-methyltransferase
MHWCSKRLLWLAGYLLIQAGGWFLAACSAQPDEAAFVAARQEMVRRQLESRDITDARVLNAMRTVPRHRFMPTNQRYAYQDNPVPIGYDQTISQPYIVAFMTQALQVQPTDVILEIGTGSGYQAAVLGSLAKSVYTIEIVEELADWSRQALSDNGFDNVHVRFGDGFFGWAEAAPFDKIILTAAAGVVPEPLLKQLREGGVLLMPIKMTRTYESLALFTKIDGQLQRRDLLDVRFVPMTGEVQKK